MSKAFIPGTVSHGTHNLYDLANAFTSALEMVSPAAYQQLVFPAGMTPDGLRAVDEGRSAEYWNTDEASEYVDMLSDALNEHAPEGYYFGAHEVDGADFGFWETEEHQNEREWDEFTTALDEASDGTSHTRKVHLTDSSVLNGIVDNDCTHFVVFAFGAYGNTYVAVPHNELHATPSIDDALEEAASKLLEVAPGVFTDWTESDRAWVRDELLADGTLTAEEHADLDSDEVADKIYEHCTVDHTYTESGYLPSWEWTIVGEALTRAELLAFARGE